MSKIIYVICGNYSEFVEYQQQNPDCDCHQVFDDTTLRGRVPGEILRIGHYHDLWNIQVIEESAILHEELWKRDIAEDHIKQYDQPDQVDDKNIFDYGV